LDGFKKWLLGQNYEFYYHIDLDGYWLNLDWWGNHPGSPFFPAYSEIAIYPYGIWKKNKIINLFHFTFEF
jgi:hypothetical protein